MLLDERTAGLLLHPTSLPGPHGIGDLGPAAHRFVDALAGAGCRLWQILPLGPTSYGNSPYAAYSSFAGNPLLVSMETLVEEGWLPAGAASRPPEGSLTQVDFDAVAAWKRPLLAEAAARFAAEAGRRETDWFRAFQRANEHWLPDYALYMALKEESGGKPWNEWPEPLRRRDETALATKRTELADAIGRETFAQFLFDRQWTAVRNHAAEKDVAVMGDLPIFVALDSADVWTHQELFFLDRRGRPEVVAGVPPDYFSPTGQLWGNPLYDWEAHKRSHYAWWLSRLEAVLQRVDLVRIDHFRGLEAYWRIPGTAQTAEAGTWVPGPGAHFLEAVAERFGALPLVAEDLGTITPAVDELRQRFGLPGMRVLQFGFGDEDPRTGTHAPHNHTPDSVVYTGTHDNDTTVGWFFGQDESADTRDPERRARERQRVVDYLALGGPGTDAESLAEPETDIHWRLTALALASCGRTAVVPVQDLLGLGSAARMNRPGQLSPSNWSWRLRPDQLDALAAPPIRDRLRSLLWRYGRLAQD
jgi:4-alpha-glucanotransferase